MWGVEVLHKLSTCPGLHSKCIWVHRTRLLLCVMSLMLHTNWGNGLPITLVGVLCVSMYVTWHVLEVELVRSIDHWWKVLCSIWWCSTEFKFISIAFINCKLSKVLTVYTYLVYSLFQLFIIIYSINNNVWT